MKVVMRSFLAILLFLAAGMASAHSIALQPEPSDLWDLDHHKYYTWRIDWQVPAGEQLVSAELIFHNIRNWDDNPYDLWAHLLDSVAGTGYQTDNQGGGDAFAGQGGLLFHWDYTGGNDPHEIPLYSEGAADVSYLFTLSDLALLESYSADGNFGLGFDPDCHFWNSGIELRIQTHAVPEPGLLLLLLTGWGMLAFGRQGYRAT